MERVFNALSIFGNSFVSIFILHVKTLTFCRFDYAHHPRYSHTSKELMGFLISMLPIYLTGNLHCLGMCGPLVMTLAHHPHRFLYFFGRTLSFSLLGLTSATFGMVLDVGLKQKGLSALACFLLGFLMIVFALSPLIGSQIKLPKSLGRRLAKQTSFLSRFLLRNHPMATFYFGFFTPMLPCGQTLMVFSSIALYGDPFIGLINGFAFAVLTSPSLILVMRSVSSLSPRSSTMQWILPLVSLPPAAFAFLRGFAEMGIIEHLSVSLPYALHFVLY